MAIYERYTGRSRDSYTSLEDAQRNFTLNYPKSFNFAYDVLDELGREKPDKLAMVWVSKEGEEKRFTFRDMMTGSNKAANYFASLGVQKGDKVLLVMKRDYYFWFCVMGLHKLGGVVVPASFMLTAKDYIYRCNKAQVKCVVITGDDNATERFDEGEAECTSVQLKLVTRQKQAGAGWIDFVAGFEAASEQWTRTTGDADTTALDTSLVSFSSGTTGYPKIITHDFRYPLGHLATGVLWHRVVDGGLHFTISDTGWLKAFWGKMYGQWLGESAVFAYDFDKFDPEDILAKLEKYRVTTFCVPPTMYRMMLLHDVKKYDLSALVHCTTAGEALSPEIFRQWQADTGLKIYEGFGQTETTVCLGTLSPWSEPEPGAIGLSIPGFDTRIVDEDGNDCSPGVIGEICIRAKSFEERPVGLLSSYNGDPEETAAAFTNGFYHTGDTAYLDDSGMVCYVGRNDDIIKSSGYRIGPFEVESVLMQHPSVLEVAVTGVPDELRGFAVKATIVLKPGCTGSDALAKELQAYVRANTAPYKYPRIVEFVESLPRTFNGKIRRTEIRRRDLEKIGE